MSTKEKKRARYDFVIGRMNDEGIRVGHLYLILKRTGSDYMVSDGKARITAHMDQFEDITESAVMQLLKEYNANAKEGGQENG